MTRGGRAFPCNQRDVCFSAASFNDRRHGPTGRAILGLHFGKHFESRSITPDRWLFVSVQVTLIEAAVRERCCSQTNTKKATTISLWNLVASLAGRTTEAFAREMPTRRREDVQVSQRDRLSLGSTGALHAGNYEQ